MATLSIKSLRVPLRHKLGREVVIVVVLELQGKNLGRRYLGCRGGPGKTDCHVPHCAPYRVAQSMSFQRSHSVKTDLPALISVKPRILLLLGLPSAENRSRETKALVSMVDFYSTYKVWAPMIAAVSAR